MPIDSISVWSVISVVLLPLLGGGFFLLWNRLDKHQDTDMIQHDKIWETIHKLKSDMEYHRVDSERRFVKTDDLRSLEERLDGRLGRIEDKLDAIATPAK